MLPYLGVFFLSSSLLAVTDRIKKNQKIFFVALAIILPCLLAGFRANHIGTDTEVYLMPTIDAATYSHSFSEYLDTTWFRIWRFLSVRDFERGFTIFVYITAKTLGSFWTKFILEMFIVVPVYIAIKKYGKYPIWIGMTVFYLTTYNSTLNMIRQSVAISFTLLGILYIFEKNKKGFMACLLVAVSFHISGIALILIAMIFYFVNSNRPINDSSLIKSEFQKVILVSIAGISTLFLLGIVPKLLKILGLGNYVNYFTGTFHFLPKQFIFQVPMILFIWINWKRWNEKERNARFFIVMFILTLLSLQLISVNIYSGRIAYYFSIIGVLTYPSLCYCSSRKSSRFLMTSLLLMYLLVYWWLYYGVQGIDGTIPYEGGL
ncbi:EpsG family protein [Streptococcus ruminantium]|uniref:EpsG family protein n=1 Tax=Streptococcus ruminantium TaxID=1917441 RepID=UPI0012DBEE3B|nr:EpsG family protein [Streptococcus ruminantium]